MPCSLVELYRCFRSACFLHHQGDLITTNQKTAIFVFTAMTTSNLILYPYFINFSCILPSNLPDLSVLDSNLLQNAIKYQYAKPFYNKGHLYVAEEQADKPALNKVSKTCPIKYTS
jgi:hypothetical protein